MTVEAIRQKRKYARISLPKGMRVVWHGGDLQLFSREKSCRSPPCQTTRMPFGNEMRAYLRFWRMASTVMWCTPPNVTEVLARFAKIFDPGQQCCMGVWINVQKFEAPPQLRFLHTHHCQHLYLLAFVGDRSA